MLVNKLGQLEIPFEGYSAWHHGGQEPWDEANCNKRESIFSYDFRTFQANIKDWILNEWHISPALFFSYMWLAICAHHHTSWQS